MVTFALSPRAPLGVDHLVPFRADRHISRARSFPYVIYRRGERSMGFYGRESILALIEELVIVPPRMGSGGPGGTASAQRAGQPRSTLLVEGCGGAGRTGLLAEASSI